MTLTVGAGIFGPGVKAQTNFTRQGPAHVLYFEGSPRRVRCQFNGATIADSRGAKLLYETGILPLYYFPTADVNFALLAASDTTTHCPFKGDAAYWSVKVGDRTAADAVWGYPTPLESAPWLADHVAFYWDRMDAWFEEDDQVVVHARDPYHRIDIRTSSRHVRVEVGGELIAESRRPRILFETGLAPRYYLPIEDVRAELLTPTGTVTQCPYKGTATHWALTLDGDGATPTTLTDAAWSYGTALPEAQPVVGCLAFYPDKVDLTVDGEPA